MIVCRIPFCWVRIPSRIRCKHTHTYSTHTLHTLNTQRFLCVAALVQAMQCVQPLLRPTISPTSDFICLLYTPYTHPTHNLLYTPYTQSAHSLSSSLQRYRRQCVQQFSCTMCAAILTSYYLTHISLSDNLYVLYTLTLHTPYTHCTHSHSSSSQHCGRQCEARPFSHPIVSPTTDFLTAYTHPTHTLHTLSCSSQRQGRQCEQQFSHPTISPTTHFLTPCTQYTHPIHTRYTLFAHPTHSLHTASPACRGARAGSVCSNSRILLSHPNLHRRAI